MSAAPGARKTAFMQAVPDRLASVCLYIRRAKAIQGKHDIFVRQEKVPPALTRVCDGIADKELIIDGIIQIAHLGMIQYIVEIQQIADVFADDVIAGIIRKDMKGKRRL